MLLSANLVPTRLARTAIAGAVACFLWSASSHAEGLDDQAVAQVGIRVSVVQRTSLGWARGTPCLSVAMAPSNVRVTAYDMALGRPREMAVKTCDQSHEAAAAGSPSGPVQIVISPE